MHTLGPKNKNGVTILAPAFWCRPL